MVNQDYDAMFEGKDTLKFHITYNDELKLSELSSCVKLLSKGCDIFIKTISLHFKDENGTITEHINNISNDTRKYTIVLSPNPNKHNLTPLFNSEG